MDVRVSIIGCDDSTVFDLDVNSDELEFLKRICAKSKEVSTYGCQPIIEIE